jgi:uncharacterized damage-inducible protein DinB
VDLPQLLTEMFDRVGKHVRSAVDGLSPEQLVTCPTADTNSIGWLVWHLTRVQDHHIAELLEVDQLWVEGDRASHFGLEPDPDNTGYGHRTDEVRSVRPVSAQALVDYYDAVAARTSQLLSTVTASGLDRVVDDRWDPPVTLGVRLVSVADDDVQHAGQAAYVRGLLGL